LFLVCGHLVVKGLNSTYKTALSILNTLNDHFKSFTLKENILNKHEICNLCILNSQLYFYSTARFTVINRTITVT